MSDSRKRKIEDLPTTSVGSDKPNVNNFDDMKLKKELHQGISHYDFKRPLTIQKRGTTRKRKIEDLPTTSVGSDKPNVNNFDDMKLKKELLQGISRYGFKRPFTIQKRAILPCINEHDVIVQAQSGSGKTATYSIAILQRIDITVRECQALILAPTREVATQIKKVVTSLGVELLVQCQACSDDTNVDTPKLESDCHIVVGIPSTILEMLKNSVPQSRSIKMFVLDRFDEMLSRGFQSQIEDVFSALPPNIQVILLTSTETNTMTAVKNFSEKFMENTVEILMNVEEPINSSDEDIEIALYKKFAEKSLNHPRCAITRNQIGEILEEVGFVLDQKLLDDVCEVGILDETDEINHLQFHKITETYMEAKKIMRRAITLKISSGTSSMSSDSSEYKERKREKLETQRQAIAAFLKKIRKDFGKRKLVSRIDKVY